MASDYGKLQAIGEFLSAVNGIRSLEHAMHGVKLEEETRQLHDSLLRDRVNQLYENYSKRLEGTPELGYLKLLRKEYNPTKAEVPKPQTQNPLDYIVEKKDWSLRAENSLQLGNIRTIGELARKTEQELLKSKNFGRKTLNEIKEILKDMGLHLGMSQDELERYRREYRG